MVSIVIGLVSGMDKFTTRNGDETTRSSKSEVIKGSVQ